MSSDSSALVTTAPLAVGTSYKNDLQVFEKNLMVFIDQHGLPTENVLVPVPERVRVFGNVDAVLDLLDADYKKQSVYVSKLIAAAASGLFDAALNYLWDETISEMRKRIVRYDIDYFFDLAVTNPNKRRTLSTVDDLAKLDDSELIKGASEMGLISELGYRHLDYIRYMRNWASAAHPNQNQITGLQLISWFETCVKEVITLPETSITAQIRKLLANVRLTTIDTSTAKQVGSFFVGLSIDQSSNLMLGLFGIYTNEQSLPQARANVNRLAPTLWPFVDEATKKGIGVKYGQFSANSDSGKAIWAREFLDAVGGASYIPDSIRAAEIETAIAELLTAHNGWNNFSIEPTFARRLQSLVGDKGTIPNQVAGRYVEALVDVYLTNGHGESWAADAIYKNLLSRLDSSQALLAVLTFRRMRISSKLQFTLCQNKFGEIVALAKTKVSSPQGQEIIVTIESYKPPLSALSKETKIMEKVNAITKSLGF